jgi:putative hemolysin
MINKIVLILFFSFFVFLAGMFAGSETGLYRLSRLRLRLGIERKSLLYVILGKVMHDRGRFLLSMLIGTNLTQYLATSVVTNLFLEKVSNEHTAGLLTTLLTAPILFIFSELIPKNIFFYRADILMPYFAPILYIFHKFFSLLGAVPASKFISEKFGQSVGLTSSSRMVVTSTGKHKVTAILQDTHEEGILSPVQADIINRIVSIPSVHIRSVMVPINKVEMVDASQDKSALLSKLKKCTFTRFPVAEGGALNIIGFVNIYDVLSSSEKFTDLKDFIKPIHRLEASTTILQAINIMRSENQKIVLVTKSSHIGRDRPIGILTMKDLVEELLGELVEW